MKHLYHSTLLKVLATIVASVALLLSLASIGLGIVFHDWLFSSANNWYQSTYMMDHNSRVYNYADQALTLAHELLERDLAPVELQVAGDLVETDYDRYTYEHLDNSALEAWYHNNIGQLRLLTDHLILSDGEQVIFQLHVNDIGVDNKDGSIRDLEGYFPNVESDVVLIDATRGHYTVEGESYISTKNPIFSGSQSPAKYLIYEPSINGDNPDGYLNNRLLYESSLKYRMPLAFTMVLSTLIFILLFAYLCRGAGYRKDEEGHFSKRGDISLNWFDKIYLEFVLVGYLSGFAAVFILIDSIRYPTIHFKRFLSNNGFDISLLLGTLGTYWFAAILIFLLTLLTATVLLSFIRKLKARKLFRYSIVGFVWSKLKNIWQYVAMRVGRRRKPLLLLIPYLLLAFFFSLFTMDMNYNGFSVFMAFILGFILFILIPIAIIVHLVYLKRSTLSLSEYSSNLANGEDTLAPESRQLHRDFRPLNDNLQRLDQGLQYAVERQLQADRLKTDLITNVSHDLKTPLTSIINYIDLLKREGLDGEHASSYLETLDQKANRLKQLTEDLVEASKASSGNLSVEREWLDIIELMRQVTGEFDEKLADEHLTLVPRLPEGMHSYMIWSDGSHLWRILENLLENARKYSLKGSRVYMSLDIGLEGLRLEIKNISAIPFDLSTDDLMERFVRGDAARHSEGSGLGLSITSSLASLLGGQMELDVRDDVFTAKVNLPFVNATKPLEAEIDRASEHTSDTRDLLDDEIDGAILFS